jgi:predicted aspartyl protease
MGKVIVPARIENLADLMKAEEGSLDTSAVRFVQVSDALVDTGATMLSLPKRMIVQVGLKRHRMRTSRTTAGVVSLGIYEPVRLTVQGRDCVIEVAEIPNDCPVLIGQVPLELLDFVVDPTGRRLIGNPEHGGEHMIETY